MKCATRVASWVLACAACTTPLHSIDVEETGRVALADKELHLKRLDIDGPLGTMRTISTNAKIDTISHPFFVSLGTNGRACVHCHTPTDAWTITPSSVSWRF